LTIFAVLSTYLISIFHPLRFSCAKRENRESAQLNFDGDRRVWDGITIKRKLPGSSAMYIVLEDDEVHAICLKYFSDTKFVYRKIVELLVFAWANIVTHLLQEFAFGQNLNVLMIFNFWSASHVYCTSWET